jgi:hypothetical protein
MLEHVVNIGAPILVGGLGLTYIISAYRASRAGLATGKGLRISKVSNPGMFQIYVRGRYMSGTTLIVVATALAIVLLH